jgi:hypothetical protein
MSGATGSNAEFVRAMGPVAIQLLGEPSHRSSDEYRFGTHGSVSVDLRKGTFYDHEAGVGGGVIDLVMSRQRLDKGGAVQWLQDRRHIEPPSGNGSSKIVATYDYTDNDGVLLFQVCRKEPKNFLQRRPDPNNPGGWIWETKSVETVIYHLPEVIAAVAGGRTIFVAEGEKGVDALRGLGVAATCSPRGAGEWRQHHGIPLQGADVVIVPDNDDAGRKHADTVATALRSIHSRAARVRVLELPGLPPKGDPFDWVEAGGTLEQINALAELAPDAAAWKARAADVADVAAPPATSATSPFWETPVDFFDDPSVTGTPVLSPEHLPDALFPFVVDTAGRMGVEPATVALAALVACSSVVNEAWQIQPKVRDSTWTEGARLWGAIVGPPSIMKTPVIAACTKPVDRLDAEARRRHAEEMRRYKAELAAWKKVGKDAGEPEPSMPRLDRYMVEGTTVEALSEVLRDDDEARQTAPLGKVLVRQDEMSEWLAGFDRYKSGGRGGGDRGAYLRLYNGGRYTVDRIGRGSFSVPNWSACIIGGIGSGFGIADLAGSAVNQQRTAGGLGLTTNQLNAWRTNMSPILSGDGLLQGTADAQLDRSKWWAFSQMGINPGDIQNDNAGQLSYLELAAARRAFQQNPSTNTPAFKAFQALGGGVADWRNNGTASEAAWKKDTYGALHDTGLGFDQKTADAWATLDVALKKAGVLIESALITNLAKLAPQLGTLSGEVAGFITSIIKNDAPAVVKDLSDAMRSLGGYLNSNEFKNDTKNFEANIAQFITGLGNVNNVLQTLGFEQDNRTSGGHLVFGPADSPNATITWQNNDPNDKTPPPWLLDSGTNEAKRALEGIMRSYWKMTGSTIPNSQLSAAEAAAAKQFGVDPAFQQAIFGNEAGLNPDGTPRVNPNSGATGVGQLMPWTAVGLGVNPYDTRQNIKGSTQYMSMLLKMFGGDPDKAAAAYDMGPAALKAEMGTYGNEWRKHLPDETSGYLDRLDKTLTNLHKAVNALTHAHKLKSPTVTINNKTGADVHVAANNSAPH